MTASLKLSGRVPPSISAAAAKESSLRSLKSCRCDPCQVQPTDTGLSSLYFANLILIPFIGKLTWSYMQNRQLRKYGSWIFLFHAGWCTRSGRRVAMWPEAISTSY
jgi:hypothetical protein